MLSSARLLGGLGIIGPFNAASAEGAPWVVLKGYFECGFGVVRAFVATPSWLWAPWGHPHGEGLAAMIVSLPSCLCHLRSPWD